jgi:hypothetical protein
VLLPRAPPPRELPPIGLPSAPVPPGQARVVLDTTDGPMRVSVQSDPTFVPPGADRPPSRAGELCITPCVADLPMGRYRLFLSSTGADSRGDTDDILLGHGTTVYRRAPGKYETPSLTNAIPPAILVTLGIVLVVWSPLVAAATDDSGTRTAGIALTGLGLASLVGGGIWLYDSRRAVEQEGATTLWQEPAQ